MARIGPNPVVHDIVRHAPRIAIWAVALSTFATWPLVVAKANKLGWWHV